MMRVLLGVFVSLISTLPSLSEASVATIARTELGVPYVLTGAWVKSTSDVMYLRARSVRWQLGAGKKTLELVDREPNGLGTLYSFPIVRARSNAFQIEVLSGLNRIYFQPSFFDADLVATSPEKLEPRALPVPESLPKSFKQTERLLAFDVHDYPYPVKKMALSGEASSCAPVAPEFCAVIPSVTKSEETIKTEVHLRLAPQNSPGGFKGTSVAEAEDVGYYSTFPDLDGTSLMVKAASKRPMVWRVQAPQDLRAAIDEAASYWNQIFGREFLRIEELPAGFDIWQPYVNSLVFYPNDPSGGAAGQFSTLPTGEMVTSHIYVPAGFLGFASSSFDYYLPLLKARGLSDTQIAQARTRFIHDYSVQTFAHEIGHALGLRHNFKGSRRSSVRDLRVSLLDYLMDDKLQADESPSSSLMDYMGIDYFALMGAKIRQTRAGTLKSQPLAYDAAAIAWGYSKSLKPVDEAKSEPYCDLPQDKAQERYTSPTDPTCGSWDEPEGLRILRLDLGGQKAQLVGTRAQILRQCRTEAWDADALKSEAPKDLVISTPGGGLTLRSIAQEPFRSSADVCKAVETVLDMN